MWRLYRLLVGLITCNRIFKVGGYMATFGTLSGIVYFVMTLLYHQENAYGGIIFLSVVPPTFSAVFCLFRSEFTSNSEDVNTIPAWHRSRSAPSCTRYPGRAMFAIV